MKKELIKALKEESNEYHPAHGIRRGLERAVEMVEELLETEAELLIVPQFVADWYEENEDDLEFEIFNLVTTLSEKGYDELTELEAWFNNFGNEPIETIMKMKLFGYEVEKEKLYYVLDKQGKTLLMLMGGEVCTAGGYVLSESTFTKDIYQLTEKQIKDCDERYWSFAVEVRDE